MHLLPENETKRETIAEKALKHIAEHHTDLKRAEYILEQIHALPLKKQDEAHV